MNTKWMQQLDSEIKGMSLWEKLISVYRMKRGGRLLRASERYWLLSKTNPQTQSDVKPHDNRAVLRMNSSFLEVVDSRYGQKGLPMVVGIPAAFSMPVVAATGVFLLFKHIILDEKLNNNWLFWAGSLTAIIGIVIFLCMLLIPYWVYYDIWPNTHYPIRFCRKTRMVYAQRRRKPMLAIPWDDLDFLMYARGEQMGSKAMFGEREFQWELRAVELDKHKKHVKNVIVLSPWSETNHGLYAEQYPYWEYIRRYMQHGPDRIAPPAFMVPCAQRESLRAAHQQLGHRYLSEGGYRKNVFMYFIVGPAVLIRWVIMRLAPRPKWPAAVEAACAIAPDDAYRYESDRHGHPIKVEPIAANSSAARQE